MTLTAEQRQAIQRGEAVPVTIDGNRCVIVREEALLETTQREDEESPRSRYAAVLKAIDSDDENTDQYLEYLNDPR